MRIIRCKSQNFPLLAAVFILLLYFTYLGILFNFFRRGFDLTDESYYLLHSLHWRSIHGLVNYFGAFLAPVFYLVGKNVWVFRCVGLLLIIISGFSLGHAIAKNQQRQLTGILVGGVLGCFAISFYGSSSLYTPGYNLLTLVFSALATSFLILITQPQSKWQSYWAYHLAYALCMGALFWNKFSVAPAIFVLQMGLLLFTPQRDYFKFIFQLGCENLLGIIVILLSLLIGKGNIFFEAQRGWKYLSLMLPRNILAETGSFIISDIPHVLFINTKAFLFFVLMLGLLYLCSRSLLTKNLIQSLMKFAHAAISGLVASLMFANPNFRWTGILVYGALSIIFFRGVQATSPLTIKDYLQSIGRIFIFATMPAALSFGTNTGVIMAASHYVLFPAAGYAYTLLVWKQSKLTDQFVLAGFCLIALVPLGGILQPWYEMEKSYRLNTSLAEQRDEFRLGTGALLADTDFAKSISDYRDLLKRNGFQDGTPILDLTGGSPGLIYLVNGKPLPVAWVLGGYPGSLTATQFALSWLEPKERRQVWLLISPDHPRRIEIEKFTSSEKEWLSHFIQVGDFTLKSQSIENLKNAATIQVWRPLSIQ